jgi:hypothetical protein
LAFGSATPSADTPWPVPYPRSDGDPLAHPHEARDGSSHGDNRLGSRGYARRVDPLRTHLDVAPIDPRPSNNKPHAFRGAPSRGWKLWDQPTRWKHTPIRAAWFPRAPALASDRFADRRLRGGGRILDRDRGTPVRPSDRTSVECHRCRDEHDRRIGRVCADGHDPGIHKALATASRQSTTCITVGLSGGAPSPLGCVEDALMYRATGRATKEDAQSREGVETSAPGTLPNLERDRGDSRRSDSCSMRERGAAPAISSTARRRSSCSCSSDTRAALFPAFTTSGAVSVARRRWRPAATLRGVTHRILLDVSSCSGRPGTSSGPGRSNLQ